jgi:hypothetical protein
MASRGPGAITMRMVPSSNGYLLENSSGETINLTMEEALGLAPLARQIQDHIRSRYPRTFPLHSSVVSKVVLRLDAHHTQVIVQMQGPDGLDVGYQISLDTAKSTRDGLMRKIEQIESAERKRTTQ